MANSQVELLDGAFRPLLALGFTFGVLCFLCGLAGDGSSARSTMGFAFLLCYFCGIFGLADFMAERKGMDRVAAFALTMCLNLLGLVIVAVHAEGLLFNPQKKASNVVQQPQITSTQRTKFPCPECSNVILLSADSCPHCHAYLIEQDKRAYLMTRSR